MARQPVSTQVQGRNLAVTAAPVNTMVQPTAPTGGQILLQQLANIDSGIKGIIGGVQQLSQTRLNQQVFELEQDKRIAAEAARLKNAEAQAAKEAEAARKAMLKKSQEEALEIARQKVSLAAADGDTSQLGSVIIEQANTGDSKGARDIATSIGRLISSDIQSQIATETQGMSDVELRSYDAESRAKQLFNQKAQGFGLSPDSLKYIDAGVVQEMQRAPQSALNTVVSQAAEQKNKRDETLIKLDELDGITKATNKITESPVDATDDFAMIMRASAAMGDDPIEIMKQRKSYYEGTVSSVKNVGALLAEGTITPEQAKEQLDAIKASATKEIDVDGKMLSIASYGKDDFSSMMKTAYTQVKSAQSANTAKASITNVAVMGQLKTLDTIAVKGDVENFKMVQEALIASPEFQSMSEAEKALATKKIQVSTGNLYSAQYTTNIKLTDTAKALNTQNNMKLENQDTDDVKAVITGGKPLVFSTPDFTQGVVNLQGRANGTLKGNEAAVSVISDTFKVQPLNSPDEFKTYSQNLAVLSQTNPDYFKKVLSEDPRAKHVFSVSQAAGGLGTDPAKALEVYNKLNDPSRVDKTYSDSISATASSVLKTMVADQNFKFNVSDPDTRLMVHEAIKSNLLMGVPVDNIPATVQDQLSKTYTVSKEGRVVKVHDGFFSEDEREKFYDESAQINITKNYITTNTKNLIESKGNQFTETDKASIDAYFKSLEDKYSGFVATPDSSGRTYIYGRSKDVGLIWDSETDILEPVLDNTGKAMFYPTKDSASIYLDYYQKSKAEAAAKSAQVQLAIPLSPMQ